MDIPSHSLVESAEPDSNSTVLHHPPSLVVPFLHPVGARTAVNMLLLG